MAHQWYKKYRPRTFAEYAGDFADAAVKRFSDPERRPQITLLYGHYGCGKTTAARLLAGYYLCEALTDKGTPCGKCDGCRQLLSLITDGEDDTASESIQEINGSIYNKVDDIKRIINESMLTLPSFSKYKVFIIDECHRITPDAQNALLKILEDVPEHLVVIFATTEREKLLSTVVSRCQLTIEVRKQTLKSMTDVLENIARQEGLIVERRALQLIAKKGGRVPRDCINLLEDIAAVYDSRVTTENVLERTGETDTKVYFKFIEAAHKGLLDTLTFVSDFSQGDVSYQKFVSGLSRFVLEAVYVRMGISAEDFDAAYLKMLKKLFERYKVDEFGELLRLIDIAAKRNTSELSSVDLALSVLALNIGDITKVRDNTLGDAVKTAASAENSAGASKFVERESEIYSPKEVPTEEVDFDEFMASLGGVAYTKGTKNE